MKYYRNLDACTRCGACARDCSPLRYGLTAAGIANPDDQSCESCGHCYSLCPRGAILTAEAVVKNSLPRFPQISPKAPSDVLFEFFTRRRSERWYQELPVDDGKIKVLLEAAGQTPSGGNARTVKCALLFNDEERRRLLDAIRGFYRFLLRISQVSILRVVIGTFLGKAAGAFMRDPEYRRRFTALVNSMDSGIDPVFYNAPVVLLFYSTALMPTPEEDAVMAAYNASLMATTLGLGSCFVSMAQKAIAASGRVRKTIGLANGEQIHAVLSVGYPSVTRLRGVISAPIRASRLGAVK